MYRDEEINVVTVASLWHGMFGGFPARNVCETSSEHDQVASDSCCLVIYIIWLIAILRWSAMNAMVKSACSYSGMTVNPPSSEQSEVETRFDGRGNKVRIKPRGR